MKYYEVNFKIQPCSQDAQDILAALAGEAGFETFDETDEGVKGYVQQKHFDKSALDKSLQFFPIKGTHIIYEVAEAEDKDWNAQWEQEGFEPIIIEKGRMIIHDGRHLPDDLQRSMVEGQRSKLIEIDAHLAFGTGTHETTRMICSVFLGEPLKGKNLLDAGCGTGILGIAALKLGAESVTAYDIDEWSAENTRHNAVINQVDNRLQPLCGDSSVLSGYGAEFDLVMANINRNILLADMPRFVNVMAPHSTLILSGFYETDCALLESKAQQLGLRLTATKTDSNWACMVLNTP